MAGQLNVLLVVIDSARAPHLSCAGYHRETTPFLDRLAGQGVRFVDMIATAPWTLPVHASLFTGLPAATHGATEECRFLSGSHKLLPEYLKAAGYRTAGFCVNPWVSPETGFGTGFDAFFAQRHHNRVAARALLYGRSASDRLLGRTDAGARRTNQALRRWIASGDEPFFAFVHYNELNLSSAPPAPYDRLFLPKGGTDALATLTARYDGALRYVDTRLREVADFLHARGVWERTCFIVAGAAGMELGACVPAERKFSLADAWLRVPLLLRCPSVIPQGFLVSEFAQTTDILPTILRLVGVTHGSAKLPGRALLDDGRATPGPPFVVAERFRPNMASFRERFPDVDPRPFNVRRKAIRSKRDKFVWHSDEANEFYDLLADPGEEVNRIEQEAGRAEALRRHLFEWLAGLEQAAGVESLPEVNERVPHELRGPRSLD